jgi:hypothetical protein
MKRDRDQHCLPVDDAPIAPVAGALVPGQLKAILPQDRDQISIFHVFAVSDLGRLRRDPWVEGPRAGGIARVRDGPPGRYAPR